MEMVYARAGYGYESRGVSASRGLAARSAGWARERLLVSPFGWLSYIGVTTGSASEFVSLIIRSINTFKPRAFQVPIPHEVATVWGASDFIHALIPALGVLDGGMTVLVASLVLRFGVVYWFETKKPLIAGVTKIRSGRLSRLSRKVATVLSYREGDRRFGGGERREGGGVAYSGGRSYLWLSRRNRFSGLMSHEVGHAIDNHVTPGGNSLERYANTKGGRELWTHSEWLFNSHHWQKDTYQNWSEVFADAIQSYVSHPLRFKLMYPNGARLMRDLVNNSPAGKYIQLI